MKTGIQSFQYVLDTRLRGYDERTEFTNRLYLVKVQFNKSCILISQIHVIARIPHLFRRFLDQLDRAHRTDFYAGLLAVRTPLFAPEGRLHAKIALRGFPFRRIPGRPVGDEGASAEAGPAADALRLIDHSHIAALCLNVTRAGRTVLNAKRRRALSALAQVQIFRKAGKGILRDLYSGQGIIAFPFVDKGTGNHTAATAVAFLRVYH